jgi:hypothetical protein
VGPGTGLDRCGKSRPTGIRSPDLAARSESLYRQRYPGSPEMTGAVPIFFLYAFVAWTGLSVPFIVTCVYC